MLNSNNKVIAIVDSGIGGISILKQLVGKFNTGNFIYFADNKYMPYGNKSKKFIKNRIFEILNYLKTTYNVHKIIIACNTASSCINVKCKNIEILTFDKEKTYLTTKLTSTNLKDYNTIADKSLAKLIEKHIFDKDILNKIIQKRVIKYKLNQLKELVLGCTHFEMVADIFKKYCPNTKIILNSSFLINKIRYDKPPETNIKIILSKLNKEYLINLLNNEVMSGKFKWYV